MKRKGFKFNDESALSLSKSVFAEIFVNGAGERRGGELLRQNICAKAVIGGGLRRNFTDAGDGDAAQQIAEIASVEKLGEV